MLTLPPSVRLYLARGATDIRKGIDGLCALARDVVGEDPFSGHLFAFANRRRDAVKILVWDRSGFWLFHKRLERGTLEWTLLGVGMLASVLASIILARFARRAMKHRARPRPA